MSRKRRAKRAARLGVDEVEGQLTLAREVSEVIEKNAPSRLYQESESVPQFTGRPERNKPSQTDQFLVLREIRSGMDLANDQEDPGLTKAIERACDQGISTEAIFQAMSEGLHQWSERISSSFRERRG